MTWSRARALVLAAVVAWVAVLTWQLADRQQTATEQTGRADAAEQTAADLADDIARVCRTGGPPADALGNACRDAEQVQRRTPSTAEDGRGIASTSITDGRLIVAYDDGQRRDVGQVVGPTGATGPSGPAGRGITRTALDGGRLVAAYTDGTAEDLGRIVGRGGEPGRSIASVAAADGRLIVTYSDGTRDDAGPLPPGPTGEDGTDGADGRDGAPPAGWTSTRADGSTEQCARAPSPDDAPTYRCTVTGTPPTTTAEPTSTAPTTDTPR